MQAEESQKGAKELPNTRGMGSLSLILEDAGAWIFTKNPIFTRDPAQITEG